MKVFKIINIKTGEYVGTGLSSEGLGKVWSSINAVKCALVNGVRLKSTRFNNYLIHEFELKMLGIVDYNGVSKKQTKSKGGVNGKG